MSDLGGYDGESAEVRKLIEQVHQLHELTLHPGWQVFSAVAGEQIENWQTRLSSGRLNDLHEYKFIAGWLDGARQLLGLPGSMQERLDRLRTELAAIEQENEPEYAFESVDV